MMAKTDSGPAFPRGGERGMSLRDFVATQALIGYLSANGDTGERARANPDLAAEWAYQNADAMLLERAK